MIGRLFIVYLLESAAPVYSEHRVQLGNQQWGGHPPGIPGKARKFDIG